MNSYLIKAMEFKTLSTATGKHVNIVSISTSPFHIRKSLVCVVATFMSTNTSYLSDRKEPQLRKCLQKIQLEIIFLISD